MGQTVTLLENALRAWEDMCLVEEARVRVGIDTGLHRPENLYGPIRHWRELRNHLLMIKGDDFDVSRFCSVQNPSRGYDGSLSFVGMKDAFRCFPLQLASWVISSRRVFHLSDELVKRFCAADYSSYKWSDLLWPFDGFAISFEKPVKIEAEDGFITELSMLLVSSIFGVCKEHPFGEKDSFEIGYFFTRGTGIETPTEIMSERERERFENDLRHKRWIKLNKRVANFGQSLVNRVLEHGQLLLPPGHNDPQIAKKDGSILQGSTSLKILAGLCLYLEALPAGMVNAYHWDQSPPVGIKRQVRKIITDGEQICKVEDFHILSPETASLFPETIRKGPAYTVTPHWRRAHYRRRRGQGNNPNAPRDVKVHETLVHRDQLPEGSVPGGAQSSVK